MQELPLSRRHRAERAASRAAFDASVAAPPDPETELELTTLRLALAKEFLAEYEAGTHGFANRVDLTAKLIELTRADILRFEAIIAKHESSPKTPR